MGAEATDPPLVEQDGRPVTHYQSFFQSGVYDGPVDIGVDRVQVRARAGFRVRGGGLRTRGGAPRRGLVRNRSRELEDRAVYMVLFETGSGRRVLTSGWAMGEGPRIRRDRHRHPRPVPPRRTRPGDLTEPRR